MNPEIEKRIAELEKSIYQQIAAAGARKATPDELNELASMLRAVQNLPARPTFERAAEPNRQGERVAAQEAIEGARFFRSPEYLHRKAPRRGGVGNYEQRIPWESVRRIGAVIDREFGTRPFHPSALEKKSEVPAYQSYAVVNLLVSAGAVDLVRRGAYKRRKGVVIEERIAKIAETLEALGSIDEERIGA